MVIECNWILNILSSVTPLNIIAINLFGIIVSKSDISETVLNHEKIHSRQIVETLFIGFYVLYVSMFLFNLIRLRDWKKAYLSIPFEREAYENQRDLDYLNRRRLFSWF